MRLRLLLPVAVLLAGCAHGGADLYGHYLAEGQAGSVDVRPPPATLELSRPDRYRFCQEERCASSRFALLRVPGPAEGRITLKGPEVEVYVNGYSASAYGSTGFIWRPSPPQGSIDLDYAVDGFGARIPLGVGDVVFVRR